MKRLGTFGRRAIVASPTEPDNENVIWQDTNDGVYYEYVNGQWVVCDDFNKPYEQQQADWNQDNSESVDYIKNKPTIPAAQIQSDWNQADNTKADYIKNKPNVATGIMEITDQKGFITEERFNEIASAPMVKIGNTILTRITANQLPSYVSYYIETDYGATLIDGGYSIAFGSPKYDSQTLNEAGGPIFFVAYVYLDGESGYLLGWNW